MSKQKTMVTLLEKIRDHSARVGVIGLGYVGLPFAVEKAKVGFSVVGIDQNPNRVSQINRGENYIGDVRDEELQEVVGVGKLSATTDFSVVQNLDILIICVPTPLNQNLAPDLSYVEGVTREISRYLCRGQLVSLESTTYPGTTEEIMLPLLQQSGLKVDEDFFLCHSPERVDPGNKRYTTQNTNKVIGGVGPKSLEVGMEFYAKTILKMVAVSSARAAEMVKVYENTFRAVNIALVNEMALLCDKMNLDVWEVLEAAFTKPFGIMPFFPGPGVGGHCIPLDPHYLEWKAREFGFTTRFIGLAGQINRSMPSFVREKVWRTLNQLKKCPSNSRILVIGLAYKKDLNDCRESPALEICEQLLADGVDLKVHDPYVQCAQIGNHIVHSQELTEEVVGEADLVVIATDHSNLDYSWLVDHSRCILDTRNATKKVPNRHGKVVLL